MRTIYALHKANTSRVFRAYHDVGPMLVRLSIHPWELSWEQFSTKKILLDVL